MDKPLLYIENSIQAKEDFNYAVEKYFNLINWKDECNILDVGCGPGNITYESLFPLLPKTMKSLVGIDLSTHFIDYAKSHYQKDQRIQYHHLDITTDNIPPEFEENFDNVFSFYCLHYIKNQKAAIRNMYKMLKPGREVFLNFLGHCTSMEIYSSLESDEKWKPFLNPDKLLAPTHTDKHAEKYLKELLENCGFTVQFSHKVEKIWIYPQKMFIDIMAAIDMFSVPSSMLEEFGTDIMKYMENRGLVHANDNAEVVVHYPYSLLTALASKPL